jgi:hypothetical protein
MLDLQNLARRATVDAERRQPATRAGALGNHRGTRAGLIVPVGGRGRDDERYRRRDLHPLAGPAPTTRVGIGVDVGAWVRKNVTSSGLSMDRQTSRLPVNSTKAQS